MADLIDRAALIEKRVPKEKKSNIVCQMVMLQDVLDAPTIEAKPVVHGEWEIMPCRPVAVYGCSVCKKEIPFGKFSYEMNYCHHCGADMRGET